jgi:hypothetical protein
MYIKHYLIKSSCGLLLIHIDWQTKCECCSRVLSQATAMPILARLLYRQFAAYLQEQESLRLHAYRGNGPGSMSVGLAVTNESLFSSFYSNIIVNDDIRKSL